MIKINKKLAVSLAFLAAVVLGGNAMASTVNVANPVDQGLYLSTTTTSIGSFSDTYNFTISSLSDLHASVTNHQLFYGSFKVLDIENLSMSIYDASNTLLSTSISGVSALNGNLSAGAYYAVVTGTSTGSAGGYYAIAMISAPPEPVPIPTAAWLMGSGLIGLIAVARRRERAQPANTSFKQTPPSSYWPEFFRFPGNRPANALAG